MSVVIQSLNMVLVEWVSLLVFTWFTDAPQTLRNVSVQFKVTFIMTFVMMIIVMAFVAIMAYMVIVIVITG